MNRPSIPERKEKTGKEIVPMDTKESLPHTACGGDSFTAMDHGALARTAFDLSDLTIWNNCLNLLELDKKFNTILILCRSVDDSGCIPPLSTSLHI